MVSIYQCLTRILGLAAKHQKEWGVARTLVLYAIQTFGSWSAQSNGC